MLYCFVLCKSYNLTIGYAYNTRIYKGVFHEDVTYQYSLFVNNLKTLIILQITLQTRKTFSEKPIVAFTDSTVFILDFYMLLNLWYHVLASSA